MTKCKRLCRPSRAKVNKAQISTHVRGAASSRHGVAIAQLAQIVYSPALYTAGSFISHDHARVSCPRCDATMYATGSHDAAGKGSRAAASYTNLALGSGVRTYQASREHARRCPIAE
jgi:hypothetical protein